MKKFILIFALVLTISGCTQLKPNIQHGNSIGTVEGNKWDYYDGTPIPYTSNQRTTTKGDLFTANEMTDMFQAKVNAAKGSDKAILVMNDKTIVLSKFNKKEMFDDFFEKTKIHFNNNRNLINGVTPGVAPSNWYISEDKKYYLAVIESKQMILTFYLDSDNVQSINYYPSRFLACKKIAMVKQAKDSALATALLRTALTAGIQSYTNYATGTYTGAYGNFGYLTVRDYSWAGERAGEALGTLFAGQYNEENITKSWNALNCW